MEYLIPALETECVFELKADARAAVVEEASLAMEKRLSVGPFEREDLNTFQKVIKADSNLKHDQVCFVCVCGGGGGEGGGVLILRSYRIISYRHVQTAE